MQRIIAYAFILTALIGCDSQKAVDVESLSPSSSKYTEGIHYRKLDSAIAVTEGKITVSEFFWYGCSHCEDFEPTIIKWASSKPENVILERLPAVWNKAMELHGKIYYIAKAVGKLEELHPSLFATVMDLHSEREANKQVEKFVQLFEKNGVDSDTFKQHLLSFKITSQIEKAMAAMKIAEINSTPSLMVNGKYVLINNSVKSGEELMLVVDYLIELERSVERPL